MDTFECSMNFSIYSKPTTLIPAIPKMIRVVITPIICDNPLGSFDSAFLKS
jgi:hypothetical protein